MRGSVSRTGRRLCRAEQGLLRAAATRSCRMPAPVWVGGRTRRRGPCPAAVGPIWFWQRSVILHAVPDGALMGGKIRLGGLCRRLGRGLGWGWPLCRWTAQRMAAYHGERH